MKKFLVYALVALTITTGVFAEGKSEEGGLPKVGITQNNVGVDSYQTTYDQTLRDEQGKYADSFEVIILDAGGDPVRQIAQIEDFILQQVDVIVVWPTNGEAVIPAVKKAYEAGIKVVVTNSPIGSAGIQYTETFSGPDNVEEGRIAARLMSEGLGGEGNIVQITGLPGYVTATERQQGFEEEIAKVAPGITIMDTQPGDWNREKSQRVMENFLTKFPNIDGVYAADDNMGIGALNAAKAAGRAEGMIFVGATNFGVGYDAIKAGEYYGSVYQSPVEDAKNALKTAQQILSGEQVPKQNFFETPPISAANIDDFSKPVF